MSEEAPEKVPAEKVPRLPAELLAPVRERLDAARTQAPEIWLGLMAELRLAESIERVWACSEFVAGSAQRAPEMLEHLVRGGSLFERAEDGWIASDLEASCAGGGDPELMEGLRRFRRRHMVRMAWRVIDGWMALQDAPSYIATV